MSKQFVVKRVWEYYGDKLEMIITPPTSKEEADRYCGVLQKNYQSSQYLVEEWVPHNNENNHVSSERRRSFMEKYNHQPQRKVAALV